MLTSKVFLVKQDQIETAGSSKIKIDSSTHYLIDSQNQGEDIKTRSINKQPVSGKQSMYIRPRESNSGPINLNSEDFLKCIIPHVKIN